MAGASQTAVKLRAPERRVDGSVVYQGIAARTHGPGNGLQYPSRKAVEFRDAAELQAIGRKIAGKPVVFTHPRTKSELVEATTPIAGRVTATKIEGDFLVVDMTITDKSTIQHIDRDGVDELSLGYWLEGGVDARGYQKGTEVDHLAIVPEGRCGGACNIRTDCAGHDATSTCACKSGVSDLVQSLQGKKMELNPAAQNEDALRSLEAQRAAAAADAQSATTRANAETLRADTAEGKIAVLEGQIAELRALIAAGATAAETDAINRERTRADAAERAVAAFDETFAARVAERVALERKATIVIPDLRMDNMTDRDVMAAVVKRLDANADISAGVADGIIRGRFLASTERHASHAQSIARVTEIAMNNRQDASTAPVKPLWQQPLPNARKV